MSFLDHLEELRWHLIRSLLAIGVFMAIAFFSYRFVIDVLIFGPRSTEFPLYNFACRLSDYLGMGLGLCLTPVDFEIIVTDLTEQFLAHLKVSAILGFTVAFPYVFWEFWRFIRPGLHEDEAQYTRGIVFFSSLLFFIGVSFGYLVLAPLSINFFAGYSISDQIANKITLGSYVSILSTIVMASGIMFELPMVVYFLSKIGLISPELMRAHRRHAFVIILVVAALITPADVGTQVLVTLPVYFLYEISIFISRYVYRKAEEKERILKLDEPR